MDVFALDFSVVESSSSSYNLCSTISSLLSRKKMSTITMAVKIRVTVTSDHSVLFSWGMKALITFRRVSRQASAAATENALIRASMRRFLMFW